MAPLTGAVGAPRIAVQGVPGPLAGTVAGSVRQQQDHRCPHAARHAVSQGGRSGHSATSSLVVAQVPRIMKGWTNFGVGTVCSVCTSGFLFLPFKKIYIIMSLPVQSSVCLSWTLFHIFGGFHLWKSPRGWQNAGAALCRWLL